MQFSKRINLLAIILILVLLPVALAANDGDFKNVELDSFIKQEVVTEKGKKLIKMAEPVSFTAKMKRFPEEKSMNYIYTALQISGVTPAPTVEHRMFIESKGGRIIPVYVEKDTVEKLKTGLKEEQSANFLAYHMYNYSKGPAVLVVDFKPVR